MRNWHWFLLILALVATAAVAQAPANGPAETATPAASEKAPPAPLHPVFTPTPSEVQAAAEFGVRARRDEKTARELLSQWGKPVPDARGIVIPMAPLVRVSAATYEATKLHRDEAATQAEIAAALDDGQKILVFQVRLLNRGKANWIFPPATTSGDKKALESVQFVLADDRGHFYEPLDAEAARRIVGKESESGLPVTVYSTVQLGGSFWISLPFGGTSRRTDFEANYQVPFALRDKDGNPVIGADAKTMSLRIIGAAAEKSVVFNLADLQQPPRRK
jgi:hypothetical protein